MPWLSWRDSSACDRRERRRDGRRGRPGGARPRRSWKHHVEAQRMEGATREDGGPAEAVCSPAPRGSATLACWDARLVGAAGRPYRRRDQRQTVKRVAGAFLRSTTTTGVHHAQPVLSPDDRIADTLPAALRTDGHESPEMRFTAAPIRPAGRADQAGVRGATAPRGSTSTL